MQPLKIKRNNPFTLDNREPLYAIVKDKDGYWKQRNPITGKLGAVQDLDENGKPIKHKYIGGKDKYDTRSNYWKQAPIVAHAVDSIANAYGINPQILRHRLDEEGFTDASININNDRRSPIDSHSYNALRHNYDWVDKHGEPTSPGFTGFGLDDVADFINQGKVKLINEKWYDSYNENEHKRIVHTADGINNLANIGITAATLKYMRDKAKKDYPNASRQFLDEAAGIYYNVGEYGGRRIMKRKSQK